MIPRKYKAYQLCGQRVRFEHDLQTKGGKGFSSGTIGTITNASYGITVKTDPCPHCGQYGIICRISRDEVTLLDEENIVKTEQK